MSERPRFHMAFPVRDLSEARAFYGDLLGCPEGRSNDDWVDFDFFGHQIVAHLSPDEVGHKAHNDVDGDLVPVRHFGAILSMKDWQTLADHIALLVGAGGMCLFLGALGFQYIGGIAPCEMCQWQRWAHIGAAVTGLLAVTFAKGDSTARGLAWFAILFVLTSGLIGAYQTGMEYHLLPGPAACSGHRYVLGSSGPPPDCIQGRHSQSNAQSGTLIEA